MEQEHLLHEFNQADFEPATTGQRFANYFIDAIVFYVLIAIIIVPVVMKMNVDDLDGGSFLGIYYLTVFGIIFAYYTLLEGSKGKTVGKMITKTKVISEDGSPISYGKAFTRTLCRLVPFEFISAFIDGGRMWHDKWTDTRLVKDK